MSDSESLPTQLPAMDHEFEIEVRGNLTRKLFKGKFKCHILNLKERGQAGIRKAALNAGVEAVLPVEVRNLHYMVAWLEQSLTESPDWWRESQNGLELMDYDVVDAVYQKVEKFEDEWYEQVWGKPRRKEEAAAS